jgi:hypothetical protein
LPPSTKVVTIHFCAPRTSRGTFVDKAFVSGEEASIVVHEIWNAGTQYELNHSVTVVLEMVDGQWKIADVICIVPEPVVVVSAEGCPNATTGTQLLMNEQHGYCLLYPTGYDVQHPNEHETVLVVGSLLNVEQPRAYIKVQEAGGRTTAQVADELIAALAGFDIKRTSVTIDGKAAVVLDNMPGQDTNRQVVIVHDDRLYMLTFVPASQDYGELYMQMENLYTMILNSFNFSAPPSVTPSAGTVALPPALGLQTFSGQGFALHYPANARVEVYEDHLRILGPEIGVRPADADWGWIGWAYEWTSGSLTTPMA